MVNGICFGVHEFKQGDRCLRCEPYTSKDKWTKNNGALFIVGPVSIWLLVIFTYLEKCRNGFRAMSQDNVTVILYLMLS